MPIAGRRPKPEGQRRNHHALSHTWTEVPDEPFRDAPRLPKRPNGKAWPEPTRRWWSAVSRMPHCVLWGASDWRFAVDTAQVVAAFHEGDMRVAPEVRQRERSLGTTADARLGLRIRYVSNVDDGPDPDQVAWLEGARRRLYSQAPDQ